MPRNIQVRSKKAGELPIGRETSDARNPPSNDYDSPPHVSPRHRTFDRRRGLSQQRAACAIVGQLFVAPQLSPRARPSSPPPQQLRVVTQNGYSQNFRPSEGHHRPEPTATGGGAIDTGTCPRGRSASLRHIFDPFKNVFVLFSYLQVHKIIGFAPSLLQVIMSTDIEQPVRQAGE